MARKKQSTKKTNGNGSDKLSKNVIAASGWSLYLLLSLASLGVGVGTFCYPESSVMSLVALVMSLVGLLLLLTSELRFIIVTFRVNAGLGCLLILSALARIGFGLTGHAAISAGTSLLSLLICLVLVIDNWADYAPVVKGWVVSLLMAGAPFFAVFYNALPQAREAARRDQARQLGVAANRAQPDLPVKPEGKPIVNAPVAMNPNQNPVRRDVPAMEPNQNPIRPAQPPKARPAAMPAAIQAPGASTHLLMFRVQGFADQGDPVAAAREALDGFASINLADIVFDGRAAELRIGLTASSVETLRVQKSLENVGFRFRPGVSVSAKRQQAPKTPARPVVGF